MNTDKRTYIPYIPDDLINGDPLPALLACKLGTFADKKGAILVSFAFISKLWNISERKLVKAAEKLDALQIWHFKRGDGRGHVTEWIKGANYATFVTLERVQISQIKGAKNAPYNKDIIKNNNSAGARKSFKKKITGDTPVLPRKGTRLSRDKYYVLFGDDIPREGWRYWKPEGYERFIYEKL